MNIKIGVPNKEIYNFLLDNSSAIKDEYGIQIFRDDEEKLLRLFMDNRLELMLMSPLSYGKGMGSSDFRIIPGPCLSSESYTGLASIYFNRNCNNFKSLAAAKENDFLTIASRIILAERYNSFPEIFETKLPLDEMLQKYDTALVLEKSTGNDFALDLSEQWFDTYEFPLPLGFWVCKAEDYPKDIEQIVSKLTSDNGEEQQIFDNMEVNGNLYSREGYLIKKWSEDVENSLFETLQLLYMLQIYEDIPAVKVLGRD